MAVYLQRDYIFPTKFVHFFDGTSIAYIDEGRADAEVVLLFVHGLGSYLAAWQQNVLALRQNFRCIALDLPNYGRSSRGDYEVSLKLYAQIIEKFAEKIGLASHQKIILVGHSMGGQTCVHLTLRQKLAPLSKLILIAPAGFETFNFVEEQILRSINQPQLLKSASADQIRKNFDYNFLGGLPQDAQFMLQDRLQMRQNLQEYDYYCKAISAGMTAMLNEPVFHRLKEIVIPTLVIFGENDVLIPNRLLHPTQTPRSVAVAGQSKIANSRLVMLPDTGHFVHFESANIVNKIIYTFVNEPFLK